MPEVLHYDRVLSIFQRALASGSAERIGAAALRWRCAQNCEQPFVRVIVGRPRRDDMRYWTYQPGRRSTLYVELHQRCNRCSNCLRARASMWRYRMNYEIGNAPRTWFGTLTLNPEHHFRCEMVARAQEPEFDSLSDTGRLRARAAVSGLEVTRYVKRLRKHATAKLRFVCVTEAHKSGLPHYHMFVHEQTRGALTHAVLAAQWKWGYEKWRLVPPGTKPAWYLCKYISKANVDRVRASVRYGGRQTDSANFIDIELNGGGPQRSEDHTNEMRVGID